MMREASAWSRPSPASDLDAALPGLAGAIEPSAVARLFERKWPGPGPAPTITGCGRDDVRWSPGVQCVATFRLSLRGANGHTSTIGVVTVRPDGVTLRLFDADGDLAGLRDASDATVVGPWLAEQTGRNTDPWTET